MKKKLTIPIIAWVALTVCMYGATFAEVNTGMKIVSGTAFGMLYAFMILIPYIVAKRNSREESLDGYLKSLFVNE